MTVYGNYHFIAFRSCIQIFTVYQGNSFIHSVNFSLFTKAITKISFVMALGRPQIPASSRSFCLTNVFFTYKRDLSNSWFLRSVNFGMSFLCLQFLPKTNKNTSHSSKNVFVRSFSGRFHSLTICIRFEIIWPLAGMADGLKIWRGGHDWVRVNSYAKIWGQFLECLNLRN